MSRQLLLILACLLCATAIFAQDKNASPDVTTVRGCLNRSRGNFIVIEDHTGLVYALRSVGDKLNALAGHEVEVKGQLHSGSIKTGVRSAKAGSNPSDTIHGVEGVPLQVADVAKDVRIVAKHCTAADQQ